MSHPGAAHAHAHAEAEAGAAARQWFIYYRIDTADLAAALAAARAGQRQLCDELPGLAADMMQRPSSNGDSPQTTLLEIYREVPGWPAERGETLPAAIERVLGPALAPWLRSARHVEAFVPCA
jgi:Domain of unknown function (DUF4936)